MFEGVVDTLLTFLGYATPLLPNLDRSGKFLERRVRSTTVTIGLVSPQRARSYGLAFATWKYAP